MTQPQESVAEPAAGPRPPGAGSSLGDALRLVQEARVLLLQLRFRLAHRAVLSYATIQTLEGRRS